MLFCGHGGDLRLRYPGHGTLGNLAANPPQFTTMYTPSNNYIGADSFEFQASDGCGEAASFIVPITVGTNSAGPFTVVTNLSGGGPNAIDYSPTQNALIVTVSSGEPDFNNDDFVQLGTNAAGALTMTNFSSIAGLPDEVKMAIVRQSVGGFTEGDVYFGSDTGNGSPGIGWLSADGTRSNLFWCILTNDVVINSLPLRGALYVDQNGIFSNSVVAVTSSSVENDSTTKGVWQADAQAHPKLIAQVATFHLEGVITLPNSTNQWGPWAGKIISGDEDENLLYTIDTNGDLTPYDMGIASEDIDLIPTNQDLYVCDYAKSRILKLSHAWLTNYVGDLLITQAGDGAFGDARLFILNWNGTNFVTRSIAGTQYSLDHFEHVSFAPLNLPSQQMQ